MDAQTLLAWAKQALEMLEENHHLVADNEKHAYVMLHLDLIERGKALLEQPEPDWKTLAEEQAEIIAKMTSEKYPFVHIRIDASEAEKESAVRDKLIELGWTPPAQPEPVREPDEWLTGCPECGMDSGCDCDSGTWNPPAQPAAWVGLTDEEVDEWTPEIHSVIRAIEAKLREKNAALDQMADNARDLGLNYVIKKGTP
jgi:hypothetical protein